MRFSVYALVPALLVALAANSLAHDGRRLEIIVNNGQLAAQGYISPGQPDDGGGSPRPYLNAIHGHWSIIGGIAAVASLPGFDIFDPAPAELVGHSLTLELLGAIKWVSPPMDLTGVIPTLEPLGVGETINVGFGGSDINTDTLGSFLISSSVPVGGIEDIDLQYSMLGVPTNVIYALEWRLSSSAPDVADSETIYTILAPTGHMYHQAALHLEQHLGLTVVPEPSTLSLSACGLLGLLLTARRCRRMLSYASL